MKQKNKKGFTLIELMIVIAIITIMTAIILTIDSKGNDKLKLETTAREVVSIIRTAQNNALSGKQFLDKRSCFFEFKLLANSYTMEGEFYDPAKEANCVSPSVEVINAGNLPKGVNISSVYDGNVVSSIGFKVPFGNIVADHGVYDSGESIKKSIRMTISNGGGLDYVICISPSGRIDELGITSDPCDN